MTVPRFFRINKTLPHGGFITIGSESSGQSMSRDDVAAEATESASMPGTSAPMSTSYSSSLDRKLIDALMLDSSSDACHDSSVRMGRCSSLAAPMSALDHYQSQHTDIPPLDDDDAWYSFLAQHDSEESSAAFSASEDDSMSLQLGGVSRAATTAGPLCPRSSDEGSVTSCFAALPGLALDHSNPPLALVTSRSPGKNTTPKRCRVDTCGVDITSDQSYRKRYRLCKSCMGQFLILIDGQEMRFCQQCSNLHPVEAFEGSKRSCRAKLVEHKMRGRVYRSKKRRHSESDRPTSSAATI